MAGQVGEVAQGDRVVAMGEGDVEARPSVRGSSASRMRPMVTAAWRASASRRRIRRERAMHDHDRQSWGSTATALRQASTARSGRRLYSRSQRPRSRQYRASRRRFGARPAVEHSPAAIGLSGVGQGG